MWLEAPGTQACMFCLGIDMAEVRFDKRGKPFIYCHACNARAFLHGRHCLPGIALLEPMVRQLVQDAASDPALAETMRRQVDEFIAKLAARGVPTDRSSDTSPAPQQQQQQLPMPQEEKAVG